MTDLLQTIEGGLVVAAVYVLVGFAWNVVYNSSGFLNLAVGEFYVIAAILDTEIVERWTGLPRGAVLALVVVIVASGAFAVERLILRPVSGKPLAPLMITVGLALVLRQLGRTMAPDLIVRPEDFFPGGTWNVGGVRFSPQDLVVVAVAIVVSVALTLFFHRTNRGRVVRVTGLDRDSARAIGINVTRIGSGAFVASAALAAIAGLSVSPITGVSPGGGDMLAIKSFLAVSIFGIGSYGRGICGALVIGLGEALLARYWSVDARDLIVLGGFLLVVAWPRRDLRFGWR